MSRWN